MSISTYATGFTSIYSLAVGNYNTLYVADTGSTTIVKVPTSGISTTFATISTTNICFDNVGFPTGYLYAMDVGAGNEAIVKIDVNGNVTPFRTLTTAGFVGMTVDSTNNIYYYVSGTGVIKVDTTGIETLFIADATGSLSGQALCYVQTGNYLLYGIDFAIGKYDLAGNPINLLFINCAPFAGNSFIGAASDNNNYTYAIFNDNVALNETVNKYNPDGTLNQIIYVDATFTNQAIATDYSNRVYFSAETNTVVLRYERYPCFKKDTKILTNKGYIPIQDLRKGDLVKTLNDEYKPIDMIGKTEIKHPASQERIKDQLYKCSQSEYPDIFEPLVITGCHSILVDSFINEEQKEKTIEVNGHTYVTDNKYRLPACADPRASIYEIAGDYTIYHVALENDDYYMNYGIYANGLLVETCSKRYLKEISNMTLLKE